jgi:dihydroorotate dehydrogenase (fumarate)
MRTILEVQKYLNSQKYFLGCKINSIIGNASGVLCTENHELTSLYISNNIGFITSKSCTLQLHKGNEHPRYYSDESTLSINSTGLANNGYKYYYKYYKTLNKTKQLLKSWKIFNNNKNYVNNNNINNINNINKPYIISIAGLENGENLQILENILDEYFSNSLNKNNLNNLENEINLENKSLSNIQYQLPLNLEFNLSCPNVIGKSQIGYDFKATNTLLEHIFNIIENKIQLFNIIKLEHNINIGFKLPPYFDLIQFKQISEIINTYYNKYKDNKYFSISHITCINSLGNGFVFDDNYKPAIKPKGGLGGIGGLVTKPIGLSNVKNLRELLHNDIKIIGCGGISNSNDIIEYLLVGADFVEIGTYLYDNVMFEDENYLKYNDYYYLYDDNDNNSNNINKDFDTKKNKIRLNCLNNIYNDLEKFKKKVLD